MSGKAASPGEKPRVLILGFGRLGGAFYHLYDSHYEIRGIRRNPEPGDPSSVISMSIQSEGLIPLLKWGTIVIFCPSSGGGTLDKYKETYLENIEFVLSEIKSHSFPIRQFILISSTGVYPRERAGTWTEDVPIPIETPRQEVLISTERVLIQSGLEYVILRCGGFYGEGRGNFGRILNAGKIFSSKLTNQFYPLINQDDVCRGIHRVIETGRGGTYNLVDDSGLTRKQLYTWISEQAGIPIENDGEAPDFPRRLIPNSKLKKDLVFEFQSPRVTTFMKDRIIQKQ